MLRKICKIAPFSFLDFTTRHAVPCPRRSHRDFLTALAFSAILYASVVDSGSRAGTGGAGAETRLSCLDFTIHLYTRSPPRRPKSRVLRWGHMSLLYYLLAMRLPCAGNFERRVNENGILELTRVDCHVSGLNRTSHDMEQDMHDGAGYTPPSNDVAASQAAPCRFRVPCGLNRASHCGHCVERAVSIIVKHPEEL